MPEDARFCPHCGGRLGEGEGATAVIEQPPDETGPVPVRKETVSPHLFGVTPPTALLALAVAAVALGALLLVLGSGVAGAVLLAAGLALGLAFVGVARRKPDSELARRSASAVDRLRSRVGVAAGSLATRSDARRRVGGLRTELARLEGRRQELLRALGESVYARDEAATEKARAELEELDRTTAAKEEEMRAIVAQTEERLRSARLEVQRTELVEVPGDPPGPDPGIAPGEATPPEPARIPEPYPPPGEADPPQPARIPEPYPPPDEGDPPEPARIPEPGGDR